MMLAEMIQNKIHPLHKNKHLKKGVILHSDSDDNVINNKNSKVSHKQNDRHST